MSSRKKHLKQIKNDLLEYKQLLPPNFSHHEQMLDSYETESLERFKRQNIYTYCDLELSNLGNPAHLLLSSDNKYLIIIGQDNHIYIYDFIEKTSLLSEPSFISLEKLKFTGSISCVTLCEKSKCLFVGSVTGQIGKIELDGSKDIMQSLTLIKTIGTSPATSILSLSVSNDGKMLIYSDSEGIRTITLSVSEGGKGLDLIGKHYKSAFFVGQKQNLFINKVGSQSSEHCYEIRDRFDQKKILKPPESRAHYCVKLLQNKQYYLTLINKDSLAAFLKTNKKSRFTECQVFEVDKPDKPFRSFKLKFHHSSDFDKLQFHITKDDRFLCYYATNTSILYIYDFKAEKTHQMAKISGLAFPESRAVFSEDDSYLVIVQSNGIVIVCDLLAKADNLISHRILESFEGTQESFAVSNDFKHLAYFQKNKDVEVLDLKRNEVILSLPLTRHNKKLVSASMKFTQAPEGILIEYRFMSEIDSHKILECSVFKGLPPEKPVQPINIYDLRPTSYQNLDAYTMKDVDETEPLHNRDALMRGHEKPKETRGKAIVRNVTNAASFTRQLTNMILKDVPKEKWLNKKDSWHRKSLSFIAAQECVDNVMAKSETYLVAWFTDSTVKVYNFPALQEVYSWKSERGKVLSVVTSPNDDLILTISNDGFLEMRSFNFPAKFSSSSQKSSFYTFERYLRLDKISLEDGLNNPQNYYLSHEQTLLHLKSLANSDDLPNLIFDPASKVPFLRDKYNKTPLHYILCHEKLDYSNLNAVATYMLEYMKALKLKKENECEYVIESLNDILPILMLKLQPDLAAKYVEMAAPLKLVSEEKIDSHVFARNKVVYFQDTEFQTYMMSELREGPEPIVFKELGFKIDYRPQSKDMMEYTLALSELEVEDLFKLPAVAHLVDYIWQSTKKWNFGLFIWFSILMILLSVYVGMGERRVGLEVTILVLATIGMNIELTQALTFGRRYWKTLWNKLDLVSLILIYVFIIFKFCDVDDELAENWIAAFMIFSGYIRLGAYLRFFRETRQLIEVIVTIIKDMISFLVIMILITIGFSVIFLKFLRSDQDFYLWHLYYSYQLWYGNTDGIPSDSPSVLVLECAIMFIMPVVLLNLLVTLMGESREKVKDRAILTDAKTRLSMSIEAMALMRIVYSSTEVKAKSSTEVAPEKKEPEKGTSLFVCIPKIQDKDCEEADKADEMTEIKGQIKDMMQILKELKEQQAPQKERMDDTGKDEALEAVKKFMKEMKTDIQKQILLETSEIKAHIHNQKMPPITNHHKGGSPHGPNKDED